MLETTPLTSGNPRSGSPGTSEKHPSKCGRWGKITSGILCAIIVISVLIYSRRLGIGNEVHVSGEVKSEKCQTGSNSASSMGVLTFNSYLINCDPFVPCEDKDTRKTRVKKFSEWFSTRTEDVVLFQEVWSYHDILKQGMADAGFCHYVMTNKKSGSGLAIFSKFPIVSHDFRDWFDVFGIGEGMNPGLNPEALMTDKGILYAKIKKDEDTYFNFFDLHTNSDSTKSNHKIRLKQYKVIRKFIDSKHIPSTEMVLLGGDFNEEKNCSEETGDKCVKPAPGACNNQSYYKEMVDILEVDTPSLENGYSNYTFDTTLNTILEKEYTADKECHLYRQLLDYLFYCKKHMLPAESSYCEIIPAKDSSGGDLSDHFPISCKVNF